MDAAMMVTDLIFLVLLILAMKAIAKAVRTHASDSVVINIADNWGYVSHVALGYLAAVLMPPAMAGLMVVTMFAFYEVMHYVFPNSRPAIIQFMTAYTATLIYLYKLPIKI